MKKELAIIIPAYNEEAAITNVIEQWCPIAQKYHGKIIFINDGSKDQTKSIIQEHIENGSPLELIDQENLGHGMSCLRGYQFAIEQGYQWIFQTDSDGQTNPADFEQFWTLKEKHPLIFGCRHNRKDGFFRKIISFILRLSILLIFGKYIKDANVPFRLIRSDLLNNALKSFPSSLYLANAYLSIKLASENSIKWIPISFANRYSGTPSVKYLRFFHIGRQVIQEFSKIKSNKKAMFPLETFTLCYLSLPLFLFFWGWLNWWLSIPLCLLLLYGLYKSCSHYPLTIALPPINSSLILAVILITMWVYLSGSGSLSFQNGDYQKHNAMLYDLVSMPWPISYKTPQTLVYYLGYYMTAGFIGKIFGIFVAHKILFLWTLIGVYLALAWFFKIIGKFSTPLLLFFIFFSGLDFIGTILNQPDINLLKAGTSHIEWWAGYGFWQYSSNTAALYWTPQHIIPAWLITSFIISNKGKVPIIFIFALSSLWSPFVMLGLIPFLFLDYKENIKNLISIESLAGLLILLILGLFYLANTAHHRSNFLWTQHDLSKIWPLLLLFYLLEFGIFYLIIAPFSLKNDQKLYKISLLVLILIPWYQMGHYNDFGMRSSLPAIFIMQILIAKYFIGHNKAKALLIICLLFGSFTPLMEISRSFHFHHHRYSKQRHLPSIQPFVAAQYMGSSKAFFFRYLSKPSHLAGDSNF